ncbi:MAG: hypothetical protein Kow0032_00820 [Methyloligellaceae bacterium]
MQFLDGYKTYIVTGIFILAVIAEKFLALDVPGFDPGENWLEYILAALGLGALRNGIAKAE